MTNTGGWPGSETNDGQTDMCYLSLCESHTQLFW